MKNIKYTPLIISFLFVLCCLSCKDEEIYGSRCCVGPSVSLSLHIADIEGAGTSEKARKDFLSKVSMYYFSKTGVFRSTLEAIIDFFLGMRLPLPFLWGNI